MNQTKVLGNKGEFLIARFLEKEGYRVLKHNYQTRFGEIDLIAEREEYLVFIEVKTRKIAYFSIASVVTRSKQQKIIKTAKYFLTEKNITNKVCRFDVATVVYDVMGSHHVDYITNAFYGR